MPESFVADSPVDPCAGSRTIKAMLRLGLACALLLLATGAAGAAEPPTPAETAAGAERANGTMGAFAAAGADPAHGAAVYAQKCASCHDAPNDRTPSRTAIGENTPTTIAQVLLEGVMAPMARGLTPHDIASVAAFVSTRNGEGLDAGGLEAPRCAGKPAPLRASAPSWNGWGHGETQPRFQPKPGFAATDAPRLRLKWAMAYAGTRNGQATVFGGRVFLTSSSGAIYALDARTGCAHWRFNVPGGSRSSITVSRLPGGRWAAFFTGWTERTAYALDAETGAQIWKTRVDDQNEVQMTGSPVLHAGRLYIPVSSAEEAIAVDEAHPCCRFRGAVVAVDAATGRVLWRTFMGPAPQPTGRNPKGTQMWGPAGAAIWSAPTIDAKRGVLYVATGDSYTDVELPNSDAVVALDLATGATRWVNQLTKDDNYIVGCNPAAPRANCPKQLGPDHDFGVSPTLATLAGGRQVLLVGQKSSQVYALDPDARGKVIWEKRLSPGGPLGGVEFGAAWDGRAYYVAIADIFVRQPKPGLYAFGPSDGELLWQTPSPTLACAWKGVFCNPAISQAVTAMPGLVFAGAMNGRFRAYDSATGKIVWEVDTAQPVTTVSGKTARGGVMDGAGPTIAGGVVYVTSGYQGRSGTPGMLLMAFSIDGK